MPFSRNTLTRRRPRVSNDKWLLVIRSARMTSVQTGANAYILSVPVNEDGTNVVAFTDRPEREAQVVSPEDIPELWGDGSSFRGDPPNGFLDYSDARTGKRGSAVVVITGASLEGGVLRLTVTLGAFSKIDARLEEGIPAVMLCANLFVDNFCPIDCHIVE